MVTDLMNQMDSIAKLFEVCSAGIGKLFNPTYKVRMAKSDAKVIEIITDSMARNESYQIEYVKDGISIKSNSMEELEYRTSLRLIHQELLKQHNIERVINLAYQELENSESVTDEPLDQDWITRFFNLSGEVSREDMQQLWGHILAGEIKLPGSYSLRTLDIIKNISKQEAETWEKVAPYTFIQDEVCGLCLNFGVLPREVTTMDLTLLNEAGLINLDTLESVKTIEPGSESYIIQGDKVIVFKNELDENLFLKLSFYMLTKAGVEILDLINKDYKEDYISRLAYRVKQDYSLDTFVGNIKNIEDGIISYETPLEQILPKA